MLVVVWKDRWYKRWGVIGWVSDCTLEAERITFWIEHRSLRILVRLYLARTSIYGGIPSVPPFLCAPLFLATQDFSLKTRDRNTKRINDNISACRDRNSILCCYQQNIVNFLWIISRSRADKSLTWPQIVWEKCWAWRNRLQVYWSCWSYRLHKSKLGLL